MLEHFPGYETCDLDVARSALLSRFGARRFEASPGKQKVFIKANWAETKHLKVITSFCSAQTDTSYDPLSVVRQYFEIGPQGRLAFEIGSKTTALTDAHPFVIIPSSVSFRVKALPQHQFISLRIENEALKNGNYILDSLTRKRVVIYYRVGEANHESFDDQPISAFQAVPGRSVSPDLHGVAALA